MANSSLSGNTKFGAAVALSSSLTIPATIGADVSGNLLYAADNYDGTASFVPKTRQWASGSVTSPTVAITGVPTTISASGNSDDIDISMVGTLLGTVIVGAPSGSSPTLACFLDVKDALGNYLPVVTFTILTGASLTYASTGPGSANVYVLTRTCRFRWVIGGTGGPSFPSCAVALAGR